VLNVENGFEDGGRKMNLSAKRDIQGDNFQGNLICQNNAKIFVWPRS